MGNKEDQTEQDELNYQEHNFRLTNQEIIELAYITMDMIELCVRSHCKLFFEEANCYPSCFNLCRQLLRHVDSSYLRQHDRLMNFYREGKELSNEWDRLSWINSEDNL